MYTLGRSSKTLSIPANLLKNVRRHLQTRLETPPPPVQDALDEVLPGDTIRIESGHYWEDLVTTVSGTLYQNYPSDICSLPRLAITAAAAF